MGRIVAVEAEVADAFRSFLQIEAGGWKGKKEHKGWAIRLDPALEPFAAEMIEGLTLTMNKIRQAAITREIIEVVSGAQA